MSARHVEQGCIASSISSWCVNLELQVNEVQVSLTMHGRAQGVKGTLHRRSREARSYYAPCLQRKVRGHSVDVLHT